jgi:tRNA (cmo5U34)-methyltransferase
MKSSVEQIRQRFDQDVERFSNLETGQSAIIDAVLLLELVARSAAAVTPHAHHVVDVGCGGGNFSLRLLQYAPHLDCTLIDLSRPMLDRAEERLASATTGHVATIQGDVRAIDLPPGSADIILAGSSLHHLRADAEWESVFAKFASWLRPGGSAWFSDLIDHDVPAIQAIMWARYGDHLTALKDEAYRDHVFNYVEAEDTPRPLFWQLELLRRVGFDQVEVLHKNAVFAAFGGVKTALR